MKHLSTYKFTYIHINKASSSVLCFIMKSILFLVAFSKYFSRENSLQTVQFMKHLHQLQSFKVSFSRAYIYGHRGFMFIVCTLCFDNKNSIKSKKGAKWVTLDTEEDIPCMDNIGCVTVGSFPSYHSQLCPPYFLSLFSWLSIWSVAKNLI